MKKYILFSIIMLTIVFESNAQVTIGSDREPISSALLQLKERESTESDFTTATKGFSYPRVALTKTEELYPMYGAGYPGVSDIVAEKKNNTGLVVTTSENASVTPEMDAFVQGLYLWNGTNWSLLLSSKVIEPSIEDLICGSATLSPAAYTSGVLYKGVLKIPYTGGNGGYYDTVPQITVNNLTFTLQAGQLGIGNGEIYYNVLGTPTVSSPQMTDVPINFLGKTCIASVGNVQEVKTISFAKTIAENFTITDIPDKTITILGNLSVRIEYTQTSGFPSNTYGYFLAYRVATPNQVTVLYTKSGRNVGYVVTGRKAARNTAWWYRVKTAPYYDDDLVLDENASTGPSGSRDDLNPTNRDIVETIFMLHNTNEVYRVTINSNGAIAADGLIPAIPPTVTIFLEKLD